METEDTKNKYDKQVIYVFKIKHPYNSKYLLKREHFGLIFSVPI